MSDTDHWSDLVSTLTSITLNVGVFLGGVDYGFYGNEMITWTPGVTDPNDAAYTISFALGCMITLFLYTLVSERISFGIFYILYLIGTILFTIRQNSCILSRVFQGVAVGCLLSWTYVLHLQQTHLKHRVERVYIVLLLCVSGWVIGYLIRLVGGVVERMVISVFLCILCICGFGMGFCRDHPERIVLEAYRKGDLSTRDLDDIYCSLLESCEYYENVEIPSALVDQLLDVGLLEAQNRNEQGRCFLLGRYWKRMGRLFLGWMAICIFPVSIICFSFPHSIRSILPFFEDTLYADCLYFVITFVALIAGFVVSNQKHRLLSYRSFSYSLSFLCFVEVVLCCLEFWFSARTYPIISVTKACIGVIAVGIYVLAILPNAFIQATEIGTIYTRAVAPSLTFAILPFGFAAMYVLDDWMASMLKNQLITYLLPCIFYVVNGMIVSRMMDLNELSLYEISAVAGLMACSVCLNKRKQCQEDSFRSLFRLSLQYLSLILPAVRFGKYYDQIPFHSLTDVNMLHRKPNCSTNSNRQLISRSVH